MSQYLVFPELEKVGRLGNGLWQIASTIGLARRHGMEPRFPTSWSYRPWFNVPDEFFADVSGVHPTSLPDVMHMDERTRIYLQDLTFIAQVEQEVRSWFRPTEEARQSLLRPESVHPFLVVHVRRGDNVNQQDCYPLPSRYYYLDAVRRHPDHAVVVFGDDMDWNVGLTAEIREITDKSVYCFRGVPRPKEHEKDYMTAPILDWIDLLSMAQIGAAFCLSNSTLGWWSAWLSGSDDVCCPAPWYGPALDIHQHGYIDGSLMMPDKWEKRPA